jgi:hypothetical protein
MTAIRQSRIVVSGGLDEAARREYYRLRLQREAYDMGLAAADAMACVDPRTIRL